MADNDERENKTEEPTEKRRSETLEREGGPSSREVGSAAVLVIAAIFLAAGTPGLFMNLAQSLTVYIENPGGWRLDNGEDAVRLFQITAVIISNFLGAFVGAIVIAGIAAAFLQNAPRLLVSRIMPDFSRVSAATPAQQILVGIQRAIPAADNSQTSPGTLDSQQQPLKTITVALSPATLGNVAVELSLKSGRLGVKLQVEEPSTVQLLRQDGSLEKLLESAGYAVQSLSVHLSPQPNQLTQGQTTPNGQSFSNQFSSAGGGQEQGHSQSHKGQPEDRNADQKPGYGRTEDVRGGGSLYV